MPRMTRAQRRDPPHSR